MRAPKLGPTVIGLSASVLAVVAAVVAAVGPARSDLAEYRWPSTNLPAQVPTEGWYSPLPLLNRVPGAIRVRLPCGLAPPLDDTGSAAVLATARQPAQAPSLNVLLEDRALRIRVGLREIASVPWPASCPLTFAVEAGELRLPGRSTALHTGSLDDMPVVTGLFTELALRKGKSPQVAVTTRPYSTSWTARQAVAGGLAVALIVLALIVLAGGPRLTRRPLHRRLKSAWLARNHSDTAVVLVLGVWWIIAPTLFDDGYVWAQQRALSEVGEASIYYNVFGVPLPLGFGFAWLEHWVVASTDHLVFMRIPSLLALLAAWVLCRWCLHRITEKTPTSAMRWTLTATFLVGAIAWGMTLRSEPFVSLLILTSLAAMISFTLSPRMAPLAVAVPAVALAVTTHPTGLLAGAPLLAGLPQLIRWLRTGGGGLWTACTALLLAVLALALVLFTLDADLATRLRDAQVLRQDPSHDDAWWSEWTRYRHFDGDGGGTGVRTLSLALLVLSSAAVVMRSRSVQTRVLSLPAQSVLVGLVLLAFVPSKVPWHIGALAGIGAVAVAAEVERLIRESSLAQRSVRPVAGLAAISGAALFAWTADGRWGPLDVQRATWTMVFNLVVFGLGLALVMVVLSVSRMRSAHQRQEGSSATRLVSWAVPVVSTAVILATIGILVVDATLTSWSPARQNLAALAGRSSCGVASHLRGAGELEHQLSDNAKPTLLAAPIALYFPCVTMPSIENGLVEIPELVVVQPAVIAGVWPLDVYDSPFAAVPDLYEVSIIATGPGHMKFYSVERDIEGFVLLPAVLRSGAASVAET